MNRFARTRVLFVPAGGLGNASARTRLYAYLPYLRAHGIEGYVASYHYHRHDAPQRFTVPLFQRMWVESTPIRNVLAHHRADTLFFQKKSFLGWNLNRDRQAGRRIVYDFDDAIYYHVPGEISRDLEPQADSRFESRLQEMLEIADTVLVSGEELKNYADRFARDVRIIPSVFSVAVAAASPRFHPPVIGWVGAPENLIYLWEIKGALRRILEERPEVEIWVCTSRLTGIPDALHVKHVPWSLATEAEVIPKFAVGIAPLADTPWCRAKMNFKALVYLSYGVPAVVSPVGFPLKEFAEGKSVLTARTEAEWYEQISCLLDDEARRDTIANGGLAVVKKRFLAAERAAEFAQALKG